MEVGMMFKRLSRGAKFDTKRFLADAQKLQMIKTTDFTHSVLPTIKSESQNNTTCEDEGKLSKKSRKKQIALKVKALRKSNHIHIWGSDIPDPIENFTDILGISSILLGNIRESAYEIPTAVQMQSIPIMLAGRELLGSAPTGSGKTAAFLIPIIQLLGKSNTRGGFRVLILSPTRELAKQIHRECVRLSEGTGLLSSVLDSHSGSSGKSKKNRGDILISTPNRLVYQLKSESISVRNVVHLIVDECDHLFESGFVEQLGAIYSACDNPQIKRAFFSATCAYEVEEFCKTHLDNHILLTVGAKNAAGADLVEQSVIFTGTEAGKLIAFRDLLRKGIEPPVLVFVQSQERASQLLSELVFDGIKCELIHSGKSEMQREKIVESFREGKIWVLVCTALMSRGLDFPAVKVVINYDMPTTPVQYIHAIGRTGRAGRPGKAVTFYTEDDRPNLRRTAQILENSGFPVPSFLLKMKKPQKDEQERMAHRPTKRARISKMAKYDVEKRFKHSEMVKHTKNKLQNSDATVKDKTNSKKLKKRKHDAPAISKVNSPPKLGKNNENKMGRKSLKNPEMDSKMVKNVKMKKKRRQTE